MSIWHASTHDLDAVTRLGEASMPGFLGIRFTGIGDNWLEATMPVEARTHQPFGRLHGGASVVLAETVASMAGALVVDPSEKLVVGLEINANHLRPVRAGLVTARATAEALGQTTQVWTIRITDEAGKLVTLSRITLAVIGLERA